MSRPLKEELLPVRSPSDVSDSEKEEKVPVDKRAAAVGIFICLAAVALVVVLIVYYSARKSATIHYDVTATRLSNEPMVSGRISDFDYSYNPASFVVGDQRYLLVRVQNYNHSVGPYAVGPSMMALAAVSGKMMNHSGDVTRIVFEPKYPFEKCGTEDPRVVQHDGVTYLYYTAYNCHKAQLSLATSTDPTNPDAWVRHGPLYPHLAWSKSGAVLIRPSPPHYMYFGDSTLIPGLRIATSDNLVNWTIVTEEGGKDKLLIEVRDNMFDSHLIEGGPPPVQLSTGDYLFVYNSARAGYPSPKPGYSLQYNPGYVIISGDDPETVLVRSSEPLMTPTLSWEVGNNTAPPRSLTPNVIFVEARFPVAGRHDSFVFYYGAADTDIGAAVVNVTHS